MRLLAFICCSLIIEGALLANPDAGIGNRNSSPPFQLFDNAPIAKAGDNVAYLMTLTTRNEDEPKAKPGEKQVKRYDFGVPKIVQWKIVRTGAMVFIELLDAKGQKGEIWASSGSEVVRPPGGSTFFINHPDPHGDPYHVELGKYGYPFTSWIKVSCFDKKVALGGVPTLHFSSERKENIHTKLNHGESNATAYSVLIEAWIDEKSGVPLMVRDSDETYTFAMLPPPTETLKSPREVSELFARSIKRLFMLNETPPHP